MIWEEHTYLMIDPELIESEENISFVREEAFKHPEPIISLEDRKMTLNGLCTSFGWCTVTKDGGVLRMWYEARGIKESLGIAADPTAGDSYGTKNEELCKGGFMGYAESEDGFHWKPVRLKQVEINGSRNNNLISFPLGGEQRIRVFHVFHDPLDGEWPYKCVYYRPAKGRDIERGVLARYPSLADGPRWFVWGIGLSKDGLVWNPPPHDHDLVCTQPEHAALHRAMDGALVISDQMCHPMADWAYRGIKAWITDDLRTAHRVPDYLFHIPQHIAVVDNRYMGVTWQGVPWVQPHTRLKVARKGPTIVGLNGYLYGCSGGNPGAETFAQHAEIGLSISPTGLKFREVWPLRPFIPKGHRGTWDSGMVGQCGIVDQGDRTLFFYGGGMGNYARSYQPGLAYIPRDRYGYRLITGFRKVDVREGRAAVTLKPVKLPDRPRIGVNVSHVTRRRTIRLQLSDDKGKVIPGYSFRNCVPVTREGLRRPVRWKNGRTAKELAGHTVRIQIELHSPDLAWVEFTSPRIYAVYTG